MYTLKHLILPTLLGFGFLLACSGLPGQANSSGEEGIKKFQGKKFDNQDIVSLLYEKGGRPYSALEFENCSFTGKTIFSSTGGFYQAFPATAIFRNCSFEADLLGEKTQFLGQLNFSKCTFSGLLSFQNASFLAPVGFRECNINKDFQFQNTFVAKEATWMGSHFYGISFFQGTRFFEKAQFQNGFFHANADFTQCRFVEGAMFDFVKAEGKLDFTESRTDGLMTFRKAECSRRVELNLVKSFAPIRFIDANLMDSVSTRGLIFIFDKLEFSGSKFSSK
jgi:hypothetical protein